MNQKVESFGVTTIPATTQATVISEISKALNSGYNKLNYKLII